jgi:hypothetical protein
LNLKGAAKQLLWFFSSLHSVTLPGVRDDVNELEVSAAMDSIIESNIFESSGGI